jgi:hypothetical protein
MIHRGQLVERIVRNSGYSLTKLAEDLGISRNTLYNRFNDPHLGYRFIIQVGKIIYYDFTIDFPDIKKDPSLKKDSSLTGDIPIPILQREDGSARLWRIKAKYSNLVDKYIKLLNLLIKIAKQNEITHLEEEFKESKKEIMKEKII